MDISHPLSLLVTFLGAKVFEPCFWGCHLWRLPLFYGAANSLLMPTLLFLMRA